ncbi:Uncharacterized protein TCM_045239 [Theobroma cacao]|uniref:Uncharacterized protein n=1 Tax=Theobroma cacao TaxID=3641 RepID=A0A061FSI2_THECC|nr:Uncharacterized protein TCM_045239 [Theobroma cacao]
MGFSSFTLGKEIRVDLVAPLPEELVRAITSMISSSFISKSSAVSFGFKQQSLYKNLLELNVTPLR